MMMEMTVRVRERKERRGWKVGMGRMWIWKGRRGMVEMMRL